VVNPSWARSNRPGRALNAPAQTSDQAWLAPRAILMLAAPSFEGLRQHLAEEIAAFGPYRSWPEFAQRLWPYLRWDLEGVLYPPFR